MQLIVCFLSDFDSKDYIHEEILSFFFDGFLEYLNLNVMYHKTLIYFKLKSINLEKMES